MTKSFVTNQKQRFSIRKYSIGTASVLLGMTLVCAGQVSADDSLVPNVVVRDDNQIVNLSNKGALISSSEILSSDSMSQVFMTSEPMLSSEVLPSSQVLSELSMTASSEVRSQEVVSSHVLSENVVETSESTVTSESTSASQAASEAMAEEVVIPSLPKQGTYIYPERTDVRNEPKLSAPVQFYVNKGDKVYYDNLVTKDGTNWLTYLSYSGVRRYAPIGKVTVNPPKTDTKDIDEETKPSQSLPKSGTYRFTEEVAVKNIPKATAKTEFTFAKGESIHYDQTLIADQVQWLSYVSYSGVRRYIALSKVQDVPVKTPEATPKPTPTKEEEAKAIAKSGTYTFTQDSAIKNKPEVAAKTEFIYRKGDKVNYDRYLENDGHHWLSYVSYSGIRRYVDLGKIKGTTDKPSPKPTKEVTPTSSVKLYGRMAITDISSDGFTITISEVASPNTIQSIKVPVWSDRGGQDDLIWYKAQKQGDDTYKVQVAAKNHKDNTGDYHVHLYYDYGNSQLKGILSTKVTLPAKAVVTPTATNSSKQKVTFNGSYYSVAGKYDEVIVVNKKYPLSAQYNPGENPTAKAAFIKLRDDMIAKGYNVGYGYSGFRSYNTQAGLYQSYVRRDGQAAADRYSARPGYSEHQTGLAFDLTDKNGRLLEDKAASTWLQQHAHEYGFVVRYQPGKEAVTGFMQEAWHLRYIGKEAKDIHNSGLSLEEYYGFQGGDYGSVKPNTGLRQINLPSQGTYTFKKRTSIKGEPKLSSPELAYYNAGSTVNYDKVVSSDGYQWLSYVSFSGLRRYVAIT